MRTGDYLIQKWRMQVAAKWIPENSRVLDIGCHKGELFQFLQDRITSSIGIDPLLSTNLSMGKHSLLSMKFKENLPFPEQSFDIISMLAVIEHMQEKATVAKECQRLLRPGGRVIITVPSEMVDKLLDLLISVRLVDGMSLEEHHGFTPNQLPQIFINAGLKLIERKKFQLGLNNLFVFER